VKLAACKRLSLQPINATWYRAISTEHWGSPLSTAHTSGVTTRFNPGVATQTSFEILYLAKNQIVALRFTKSAPSTGLPSGRSPIPDTSR
jgi:hypothetical protein